MQINQLQAMQNQKTTGITFLLFIFLGLFGAHRFYNFGLTVFNVIYFCTGGLLGIMIIADCFLLWGMAKESNQAAMLNATMMDSMISGNMGKTQC
jgi:TM2 domain-containing membrane protein YozV